MTNVPSSGQEVLKATISQGHEGVVLGAHDLGRIVCPRQPRSCNHVHNCRKSQQKNDLPRSIHGGIFHIEGCFVLHL